MLFWKNNPRPQKHGSVSKVWKRSLHKSTSGRSLGIPIRCYWGSRTKFHFNKTFMIIIIIIYNPLEYNAI